MKELNKLQQYPPSFCTIVSSNTDDYNPYLWKVIYNGPQDTPYEGGKFIVNISIPKQFPFKPPSITFETKIFHYNISNDGVVCMDMLLQNEWTPAYDMEHVLSGIESLLSDPYPEVYSSNGYQQDIDESTNFVCHDEFDREEYDKLAKEWTIRYAMVESDSPSICVKF